MELEKKTKIFLGTGGIGKTTLSTVYAIKMAKKFSDKTIKLVTIDPSKRIKDYFNMTFNESEKKIDNLVVSVNNREDLMRAFISEVYQDNEKEIKKIYDNKIFQNLITGLIVSQEFTSLYELYKNNQDEIDLVIIDTPPLQNVGLFLNGASELELFFSFSLAQFFISKENLNFFQKFFFKVKKKALMTLSSLTGESFVNELVQFFIAIEKLRPRLLEVLRFSKEILNTKTEIIYVCGYNELSLSGLRVSLQDLKKQGLSIDKCFVNKYDKKIKYENFVKMKMKQVKEENKELNFHMIEKFSFELLNYKDLREAGDYVKI